MKGHTNIQIIKGADGMPAFAVIPYNDYVALRHTGPGMIPHEVIEKTVNGDTPAKAWREYFGLTQAEMAMRMDISQSAYQQLETGLKLRKSSREKIAAALGITIEQLSF